MRYQFLLFIGLFVGTLSNAQKTSDPSLFAKTITARSLQAHLNIIAGAEMEGRDTPSPGLEKAADYIAEQFKKAGVLPGNNGSYRQTFSLGKDSVTGMSLKIDDANF
ncbi:MAG TPA: peptidase M28, partial [Niabella sp.]|nr:peptidase M28 [Niabella sp.]